MHVLNLQPPVWMPNAIPSNRGWHHPQTQELLVSVAIDASVLSAYSTAITVETSDLGIEELLINNDTITKESIIDSEVAIIDPIDITDQVAEVSTSNVGVGRGRGRKKLVVDPIVEITPVV